jgi:TRAP-type mannitol/chloroaromatic compound transport system permease large subunit
VSVSLAAADMGSPMPQMSSWPKALLIIFLLGWPLEWTEIIVIFVPIFLPLLDHFGIDPILFGVLIALNLQTSFLTPPAAMSAIYLKGVAPPSVTLSEIQSGSLPFLWMVLLSMLVLYIFPGIHCGCRRHSTIEGNLRWHRPRSPR